MSKTTRPATAVKKEKEFRKIISGKLEVALKEYRDVIGKKKFSGRIRKASKLFSYDLAKIEKNAVKKGVKNKVAKKTVKK